GQRYKTIYLEQRSFIDNLRDDFLDFLAPRLEEAKRILTPNGSLYFHIDYREVHYCKILLDRIFGRECFLNEIIWAYDYGARTKKKWPAKHDNILWYAKNPDDYIFNYDEIERIPYMAPGLVGPEKAARGKLPTDTWWHTASSAAYWNASAARGKLPTDTWWHTIVSPTGKEKTGYPTQKPLGILKRIIAASSRPGDTVLDFFAGSGTTGEAAYQLGRKFILVDNNKQAIEVMRKRFAGMKEAKFVGGAAASL
ncbi:MAG TPA: site-specific DNA-methyltransferase, partial [Anaerolineales bacterium]|nr:site-specific DNA-methyltransferase [Anaerolineales bacterium]